jgi:hypothetical protein
MKTVQPQELTGTGLGWIIRNFSLGWSYLIRTRDRRYCGVWTRSSRGLGEFFILWWGIDLLGDFYTLLTDSDLVGHNWLGNLRKGLVASLCSHTSVVWYGACAASHGWVQSSSELLRCLWWNCTTSAECKTNRLAVLTVKSGLDPHMIIKLEDGLKLWLWLCLPCDYGVSLIFMLNVGWYKLILY